MVFTEITKCLTDYKQLEFKFSNEEVIENTARMKTRQEVLEDSEIDEVVAEPFPRVRARLLRGHYTDVRQLCAAMLAVVPAHLLRR